MKYQESDVSILIPTYKPASYLRTAIESALSTSAGEIIVSINDAINYPADNYLEGFSDERLKIVRQTQQLGPWGNHLALLLLSTKPWIKFLHDDDKIMPSFLKTMVAYADEQVSVVASLELCQDIKTGLVHLGFQLKEPRRWDSNDYMKRILVVGNELSCPSFPLFRRDAIDFSPRAWLNAMNCDFACNVIAASRGDVVLLPPGGIISGDHENRGSKTQGLAMFISSLISTTNYLERQSDQRVAKAGRIYGCVGYLGLFRVIIGAIRRGNIGAAQYLGTALLYSVKYTMKTLLSSEKDWHYIKNAYFWKYNFSRKYGVRAGRDIGGYNFDE